jgi:hypothetical protein
MIIIALATWEVIFVSDSYYYENVKTVNTADSFSSEKLAIMITNNSVVF